MPELNWEVFGKLPGSNERNFELLCRGVVRYNFASAGVLRSLANQPGVEFHLKLDRKCGPLGDAGAWWGWQCKWYEIPKSGTLGSARRKKIEEAIQTTEKHVPGITDWVLWTRRPLTRADQKWFSGLTTNMTLHLWAEEELVNFLVGEASVLRGTYFGDLVLTPDILQQWHEEAVAPIEARWQPEVHHVSDAERGLRRMLGESDSWHALRVLAADLRWHAEAAQSAPAVPGRLAALLATVVEAAKASAENLERAGDHIRDAAIDLLYDALAAQPRVLAPQVATAPRRLRSGNHRAALYATNAVAGCREALRLLSEIQAAFSSCIVALIGSAGYGKTQLAAQLTAATDNRPAGVLLHGRDLHAGHTLDDIARRVSVAARPVPSMESLLAAADAAGQRCGHRLPIVIDGLNEAEDPRAWKPLLAALEKTLWRYPYVLVVCTLRPDFVDEALPKGTRRIELDGYGTETLQAIREHFRYWKIDGTDASLPYFLEHPLTLRLFCEVTNPERQKVVGLEAMPGSLTALFDRFLDRVCEKVAETAPRTHRFFAHDVRSALVTIGHKLWDSRSRTLDFDTLRKDLGDAERPWDQSLVRALEHEGVLMRMPSDGPGMYVPVYDLLGGHLIATARLTMQGQASFEAWIQETSTTEMLVGDHGDRHPLADDVIYSLVGQIPRRFYSKQLWEMVDEPVRLRALRRAVRLEPTYLDASTTNAVLRLACEGDEEILEELRTIRGTANHPLNAEGLDGAIRAMDVADRDLRWTEWLRRNQDEVLRDTENLDGRWRGGELRSGDRLRARWVMWTLTSTVPRLRDQATRALYWFGRHDTQGLFDLTIDSLKINDEYVSERMLAATYGVAMAHQKPDAGFEDVFTSLLDRLVTALVGPTATAPTHHYLSRRYVRGLIAFADRFYPSALADDFQGDWSFAQPSTVSPIHADDPRADEMDRTLHMDFKNYTLGRLFEDRYNYDMSHAGHRAAVAHVRGAAWSLGWRTTTFSELDRSLAEDAFRQRGRGDARRTERYGKKYGWIGFFTYAGILESQGKFPRRNRPFSEVDIDPSFPDKPLSDGEPVVPVHWLSPSVKDHEDWFRTNGTSLPRSVLVRKNVGGHEGPWVAVRAFLEAEDRLLGRTVWASMSAMLSPKENVSELVAALQAEPHRSSPRDVPSDNYTFAGEIPWHPNFAAVEFAESAPLDPYQETIRLPSGDLIIEILAHHYAWEGYHSEMNQAGTASVPSRAFSSRFDLRSVPQGFDQNLPTGEPATLTLSGVDGLHGDILYVRKDLLRQFAGDRAVVWSAFGRRELFPYPPSPPQWLLDAQRQRENAWTEVITEIDLETE